MLKKIHILVLALFALLMLNQLSLQAQENLKPDTRGVISVNGTSSDSFQPDTAVLVLTVETMAKNAKDAAAENSRKADKVVNAMKQLIKPDMGDTVKTTSYNLSPFYEYDTFRKKNVLTGYSASNQLTITTKQIKNVGNFIDSAIANGANQVQSISFRLEKNSEYCKILLAKATQNAREQATVIAQTLGVKISGIKQANGNCGSSQPYPRMYADMKTMSAEAGAVSTPIEAGEVRMNANVNIDFYVN